MSRRCIEEWHKTRCKYVPLHLWIEYLRARFVRVPAIRGNEESAKLERLYVSGVSSCSTELANCPERDELPSTSMEFSDHLYRVQRRTRQAYTYRSWAPVSSPNHIRINNHTPGRI